MALRLLKTTCQEDTINGGWQKVETVFDTTTKSTREITTPGAVVCDIYTRPDGEYLLVTWNDTTSLYDCYISNGQGGIRYNSIDYNSKPQKITIYGNTTSAPQVGKGKVDVWAYWGAGDHYSFKAYLTDGPWIWPTSTGTGYASFDLEPGTYTLEAEQSFNNGFGTVRNYGYNQFTVTVGNPGYVEPEAPEEITYALEDFYLSQNPIPFTKATNSPGTPVVVELWMESKHLAGDFSKVAELERDSLANGNSVFDLQDAINTRLSAIQDQFPVLGANPAIADKNLCRFYLRSTAKYPNNTLNWQKSNTATVMYGGIQQHISPTVFLQYMASQGGFLTWQPNRKTIYEGQHDLLYFLVQQVDEQSLLLRSEFLGPVNPTPISVFTQAIDLTGQEGSMKIVTVPVTGDDWPTEATQLRISITTATGSPISENRIYHLERESENTRQFLFQNSLGAYDVLTATGDRTDTLEIDQELAEDPAGSQFIYYLQGRKNYKAATGYKTKAYMEYLQEFLLSRRKAEVIQGRNQGITLSTKKIDYRADYLGPQGFTFEYAHSDTTNHYSTL